MLCCASPLGGGEVYFRCPIVKEIKPLQFINFGKVKKIRGIAYSTRISPQTSNLVVEGCRSLLNPYLPDVYIYTDHYKGVESGLSPGYGVSLVAETTSGALLSAEESATAGVSPFDVGRTAARLLLEEIYRGGCVDTQSQSLALLLMALSPPDVSKIRIGKLSPHTVNLLRLCFV
ncbi:RNA 3'-terminal phosphate cyclase-like protein [Zophobas morio]|uniref:RNA 3'-terminal phosphate cyclase-like protein n=1 Tax=Zophobas morio TaxID=2755281 RepID=UPI003082B9BB